MPAETVDTYVMTPPDQSIFTPQDDGKKGKKSKVKGAEEISVQNS